MRSTFPNVHAVEDDWNRALAGARTIRPRTVGPVDWGGIGQAFGYRFGFALRPTPPFQALWSLPFLTGDDAARHAVASAFDTHRDFPADCCADIHPVPGGLSFHVAPPAWVAALPPAQPGASAGLVEFFSTLAGVTTVYPVHRSCPRWIEEDLARACYALSLLEGLYRDGPSAANRWLPRSAFELTTGHLMSLAPDYVVDDLVNLAEALTRCGYEQFPHGNAIVAPEFVPGWADGDVLVGDLLVECKGTVHPLPVRPEWLYQLLGYALFDEADIYGIRQVGI
jgi:hypothetical protein